LSFDILVAVIFNDVVEFSDLTSHQLLSTY